MWFQRFQKGISELAEDDAVEILEQRGLICRWWQEVGTISPQGIADRLNPNMLRSHLDDYAAVAKETPFISLTSGVRVRQTGPRGFGGRNRLIRAQKVALQYATDGFRKPGHIFHGYVMVLPNPSLRLQEFAEDVRDLNSYARYRRFHAQGEVTAKIEVPSVRLAKVDYWEPGNGGTLISSTHNPNYEAPEQHANIRDYL